MKNTALLLVDIQDSFKKGPRWERRGNLEFEANVAQLLDAARETGMPRFFILHIDGDPGFRPHDPEFRLMDFMNRRHDELLLTKNTRSAFANTDLKARLDALGIRRIIVTGIQMEQCCETTTRAAADLGLEIDFALDATQTFPIVNKATGREISTEALIERTDFVLRDRFARIVSSADLAKEMRGAAVSAG